MGFGTDALNFIHGFRKWLIVATILLVSVSFLISGHISGAEFVDLHKVVIPSFMAANLLEHGKQALMEWLKAKGDK